MTEHEHQIMRFEDRWWRLAGSKDSTIQRELGMKPTRYYQVLHRLVGRQDVHAAYPVLMSRLRRRMTTKRRTRGALTLD